MTFGAATNKLIRWVPVRPPQNISRLQTDSNCLYKNVLAEILLSQEDVQRSKDRILEGTEAKTSVIQFHKWLVTTKNDDLPSIDILSGDEKEFKLLSNERKLLLGKKYIQQVLGNYAAIVPIEKGKLKFKTIFQLSYQCLP